MLTKRDEYIRQFHECLVHAAANAPEISALWENVARSYRFLVEREDRLARERTEDGVCFYYPRP